MLRKYKNGHRGTVCIKKVIQKSSYFLTQGILEVYVGPREEQDGDPIRGFPPPRPRVLQNLWRNDIIPHARNRAQFGVM